MIIINIPRWQYCYGERIQIELQVKSWLKYYNAKQLWNNNHFELSTKQGNVNKGVCLEKTKGKQAKLSSLDRWDAHDSFPQFRFGSILTDLQQVRRFQVEALLQKLEHINLAPMKTAF